MRVRREVDGADLVWHRRSERHHDVALVDDDGVLIAKRRIPVQRGRVSAAAGSVRRTP